MTTYGSNTIWARVFLAFTAVVAVAVGVGCKTPISTDEHAESFPQYAAMRAELPPLTASASADIPITKRYYRACTAGVPMARHEAGWFPFRGDRMAVHLFFPAETATGTVFLVHGYLSHARGQHQLIQRLLREGYFVIAPELPGHGLSGGVRGGIASFSDYGAFLRAVIAQVQSRAPRPWHAIGHSTGAVAILEYLRTPGDPFGAVIFAAPLVRNRMYNAARVGRFLMQPLVSTFPTKYDSPLSVPRMPLSWFDAQVVWNAELDNAKEIDRPVYVLQGDRDRVVAWRYNRKVIDKLFSTVDYDLIRGASHVLYQEDAAKNKKGTLDRTVAYLERWAELGHQQ